MLVYHLYLTSVVFVSRNWVPDWCLSRSIELTSGVSTLPLVTFSTYQAIFNAQFQFTNEDVSLITLFLFAPHIVCSVWQPHHVIEWFLNMYKLKYTEGMWVLSALAKVRRTQIPIEELAMRKVTVWLAGPRGHSGLLTCVSGYKKPITQDGCSAFRFNLLMGTAAQWPIKHHD